MSKLRFLGVEGLGNEVIKGNKTYNGWFGVGVGSKYYSKENLELYAGWAAKYFNSFLFVIADDIEKYNLMAFEDKSEKEALEVARKKGNEKYNELMKIAEKFPHKIQVKRWKELSINDEYNRIFRLLDKDYDSIVQIREHLDNTLWSNIKQKLETLKEEIGENEFKKRFRILVKYAIEEIASIIFLTEFHVFQIKIGHKGERVYDNIVDRIYSKHYNKVHDNILPKNQRGNIYLQVE